MMKEGLRKATEKRSKMAKDKDKLVLTLIVLHPNKTIRDLRDILEYYCLFDMAKRSFLINSLRRLERDNLVRVKAIPDFSKGKIINYYLPLVNQVPLKNNGLLDLNLDLLS